MFIWDQKLVDDGLDHEGDFPVADPGEYEFEVEKCTANEYKPKPGGRIAEPCAQFVLQLRVEGKKDGKDQEVKVFDRLYSAQKSADGGKGPAWRITTFAKCVGIFHEGMDLNEFYQKASGAIGKAKFKIGEYQGKQRNEVDYYIVPKKEESSDPVINDDDLPF